MEEEAALNRLGWLALVLTPGLGPTRIQRAVEMLGGAAGRVFDLSLTELEGLRIPARSAQFVGDGRARQDAEQEAARIAEAGCCYLTPQDAGYPARLLEIYDPPAVLWVRGSVELLEWPGIAVVGTRAPSPYGAGMAEMLSRDLANRGLTILSGMARGVDTAAHKGALEAGERRWRCGGRAGCGLPEREQEAGGADRGGRWSDRFGVPPWARFRRRRTFQFGTGR